MSSRNEILLSRIPRQARIIEIGPSFNPVAPKADGWNAQVLDHLTREGLVTKYRGHRGVEVDRIEEVDFVWSGGALIDAVPPHLHGTFDALIASHVIEHTPDLLAFFNAAETLLQPQGTVVLAIPDKRYCFDYFQALSTTGQALAAHRELRSRHRCQTAFEHMAYVVANDGVGAWGQHPIKELTFFHTLDQATALFNSIELEKTMLISTLGDLYRHASN